MAFDDWHKSVAKYTNPQDMDAWLAETWNAAVQACLDELVQFADANYDMEHALEDLKTPLVLDAQESPKSGLTGSNDSEVVHG